MNTQSPGQNNDLAQKMDLDNPADTQPPHTGSQPDNDSDNDSDIWASDSDLNPSHSHTGLNPRPKPEKILSDLPAIRRVHEKQGYREGISAGKSVPETAQAGFDEGYPLGARLGLRCGWVLGVIEGLVGLGVVEEGVLKGARDELSMASLLREMVDKGNISGVDDDMEGNGGEWKDVEIDEIETLKRWEKYVRDLEVQYGLSKSQLP